MSIMEEYLFMSETVTGKGENMLENKQIRLWDCCESLVNSGLMCQCPVGGSNAAQCYFVNQRSLQREPREGQLLRLSLKPVGRGDYSESSGFTNTFRNHYNYGEAGFQPFECKYGTKKDLRCYYSLHLEIAWQHTCIQISRRKILLKI